MLDLVKSFKKVKENLYQTVSGLYFEDFSVGNVIQHRPGRTITDADNIWLSLIGMNQHPLHIDKQYASKTEFSQILVSSAITLCMLNGMSSNIIACGSKELEWRNVKFVSPVFVGDTIYAESEVISVEESIEMPSYGIVKIALKGYKADETLIMQSEKVYAIPKKQI
jgi:acyl dehydratase